MADTDGVAYIRTTRGAYPVLYGPDDRFAIGGSKVLRSSDDDSVALIGAGVTLHACLDAAESLAQDGIRARVIDLYSVKPVDIDTLREAARVTSGRLVVVEDHYPEGGLGGAVMEALSEDAHPPRVAHLAVRGMPGSGTSAELMDWAGISARHVVEAARSLVAGA
jgi:transketolase